MRRGAYAALAVGMVLLLLGILWKTFLSLAPEMDLWWHVPTVLQRMEGKTPWATLGWVLQSQPLFNQPIDKIVPWLVYDRLHAAYLELLLLSVFFHLANAALVFRVGQQLGLSRRSSYLSAGVYLTAFIHFHATLWPAAIQHGVGLFSVLLILSLYLTTEQKAENKEPGWGVWYGLTLLAAAAGSVQRTAYFVFPVLLAHPWAVSRSPQERGERYDRWIPLLLLFPVYAIFDLLVGDRVTTTAIAEIPLPGPLKAGLLFAAFGACVLAGRWFVRLRYAAHLLVGALAAGFLLLFPLHDKRQILFPYNALAPFATVLGSVLNPFRTALQIDSALEYYYIPPQITSLGLALSVLLLVFFFRRIARRQRKLWILAVWYAGCISYLFLHHHAASSFPPYMVSRYYVYFTPLVAWVCLSALVALADLLAVPRLLLTAGVGVLCLANLLAIPVAVFRGRLVNTYGIYDDIRVVHLIRDALTDPRKGSAQIPRAVSVEGAVPLRFDEELARTLSVERVEYENLRLVARDAWRGLPVERLGVNEPSPDPGAALFRVQGTSLVDSEGRTVDRFEQLFKRGLEERAQGNPRQAIRSLEEALEVRPFLLRYLLGSCPLSDARWMAGGAGLREWVEAINRHYLTEQSVEPAKREQVAAVLRKDLSDYALCLLYLAHLNYAERLKEESRAWVSQLQYIEPDPEFLVEWLSREPQAQDPAVLQFLNHLRNPLLFAHPARRENGGDGFGRFLARLVFH